MNIQDIELPPLPPGYTSYEFPDGGYDADEMQAYALAAIEADRQRRGKPVAYGIKAANTGEIVTVLYGSDVDQVGEYRADLVVPLYTTPQPAEPVKALIGNQEPLGEEFQHVLDEHRWDLYVKNTEPVKVNAIFETENGEAIGTTDAKVKRVEWQDDGSLTVVIDYWPQ